MGNDSQAGQGVLPFGERPKRSADAAMNPPDNGTPTSRAAARAIGPAAGTIRADVLGFIIGRGQLGATDDEVQRGLGLKSQTEGPRRIELVRAGLVRDSGQRRRTSSGRAAVVWIASTAASADGSGGAS